MKPKVVAVLGPTASGKTTLSVMLAARFNGEIVSADSRQIYRGMDIGTAKPTMKERAGIPHHLIDIKDPDEEYTVAEYQRDALAAIRDILARNKLPILVGGTGLYSKAVLENLDIPKVKPDPALRRSIEAEISAEGLEAAFERLVALDPEAAYVVDPKNPRRVVRVLEVTLATGTPFTAQRKKGIPLFEALVIGLALPDNALRTRIDARIDRMVRDGLFEEVKKLEKRYGAGCPVLDAIGYREIVPVIHDTRSLKDAIALMKTNTWHYARRQMTWFKKNTSIRWMEAKDAPEAVRKFLGK